MRFLPIILSIILPIQANIASTSDVFANAKQPATALTEKAWLMATIDSVSKQYNVPAKVMKAIAWNESRYKWVVGSFGDMGYFQIIPSTYNYLAPKVALSGCKREDNVRVAAYYLRYLHNKYGSWYKARFAYGRGHWRDSSTWSAMEKEFMSNFEKQL